MPSVTSRSPVVIDIHAIARQHRAMVLGEMLADAIVWLVRLPRRLAARPRATRPALQPDTGPSRP